MFHGKRLIWIRLAIVAGLLSGAAALPGLLAWGDDAAPSNDDEGGSAVASDELDEPFPAPPSRPNPFRRNRPAPPPREESPPDEPPAAETSETTETDPPAEEQSGDDAEPSPDAPSEDADADGEAASTSGADAGVAAPPRRPVRPLSELDPYAKEDEEGAEAPPEETDQADSPERVEAGLPPTGDSAPGDAAAAPAAAGDSERHAEPASVDDTIHPAELNGVRPGVSTVDDVEAAWGLPREVGLREGLSEHVYAIEPFERVTATFAEDVVASIIVDLVEPYGADAVAKEMGLATFEPVAIVDENGETLGCAYPERGVLFGFPPEESDRVVQVILEQITAEPFVLRAEAGLDERYEGGLADLAEALRLDPKHARAEWLKARILGLVGRQDEALRAAWAAVRREPRNVEFRLTLAKIMERAGDYASAAQELGRLTALRNIEPALSARAHLQLGEGAANGPGRDLRQAVEHYLQAIRLGQQAAAGTVDDPAALHAALVDAQLALAYAIAWGNWRDKPATIEQWLDQAATLAEQAPADRIDALRFRVAAQALAAYVGLQGEVPPGDWAENVTETGERLIAGSSDPLHRRQMEWQLGLALYDCLQLDHLRGEYDAALKHGRAAVDHLERGSENRDRSPGYAYLMGRLYFRMGVIHAIHRRDHQAAVVWFEKASPLIEEPVDGDDGGDIGRQGESFVSMAVSYWETGDRREAARLTVEGVDLMEQAVANGLLDGDALAVAYGNLSFMYRQLGDADAARRYEELAARPGAGVK